MLRNDSCLFLSVRNTKLTLSLDSCGVKILAILLWMDIALYFLYTNHFVIWKSKWYLSYNIKIKNAPSWIGC